MPRLSMLAALSVLALCTASVHADVIYSTGFESPTFTTGNISGQDGWSIFNGPTTAVIQDTVAASGSQAVRVEGAASGQHGPFYTSSPTAGSVLISADIMLSSAAVDSEWQFAGLGSGLAPFAGGFNVIGTTVQAITAGYPLIGTFARDVWNHVDLYLDFGLQETTIVLNGTTLASGLAFCGDNGPCGGAAVTSLGTQLFDTFGGGQDAGYMDNFSLSTVPEPATLALVCFSLFGLALSKRSAPVR